MAKLSTLVISLISIPLLSLFPGGRGLSGLEKVRVDQKIFDTFIQAKAIDVDAFEKPSTKVHLDRHNSASLLRMPD
jgi:hypothetical protein